MTSNEETQLDNSLRIGSEVDEVCDRFEACWRTGVRPAIEDFLVGSPGSRRPMLLGHLLSVELEYRMRLGEPLEPLEYQRRFPDDEQLVVSVFAAVAQRFNVAPRGEASSSASTVAAGATKTSWCGWNANTSVPSASAPDPPSTTPTQL